MPPSDSATVLRQRRAFAIAGDAYDVPPDGLADFLDAACEGDDALRAAVEALLAFDGADDSLLDGGVGHLLADAPPPEDVGGYRVVGELGRGGMGVVYEAERTDGVYERTVALKLVQAGRASDEAVQRFARERRVLARLDHVGIARLLDGGVTAAGRPYFVMERVDGEPITAYAARRRLDLRARLALALDVCDAVAHAHRLLIVHRDLKPSNVFVAESETGVPVVKLLDFGIAKALDDDDDDVLTRTGGALTPAYAAPEQVEGEPVTAATDVYALGVLFYELLVGRRPYAFRTSAPAEIARVVREAEPTRPSAAVAPRNVLSTRTHAPGEAPAASDDAPPGGATPPAAWVAPARQLRGDLDAILLRALRKEPERRYATAGELAADLRRHLDGRPVEARGDSVGYRASRFVRRHRAGVAVAATLVGALGVGVGAVLWQARETAREAARANATLDYVLGTFEAIDPVELEGGQITARGLVAPGLRQAAALDDQPLVQAALLDGIGRLSVSLGLFSTADSVLQRAVDIRRRALGADHPEVAGSLVLQVEARTAERDYDQAIAAGEEAIRILERARQPEALAEAQVALAEVRYRRNDAVEAKRLYRRALANTKRPEIRVGALAGLGSQLADDDSLEAALSVFDRASSLASTSFGDSDPRTADAIYSYANAIQSSGDAARASALHEQALRVYERAYGEGDYRTARSLYTLAVAAHASAPDVAEVNYRKALVAYEGSTLDGDHLWAEYTRVGLGGLLVRQARYAEALPLLDAGIRTFSEQLGADDVRTLAARAQHGVALVGVGQVTRGTEALRDVERLLAADDPGGVVHLGILEKLADVLSQAGRAGEAQAVRAKREALAAG